MRAQLFVGFVSRESTGGIGGAFGENAARGTDIDGMEVIPILDLRAIRVAQFFVQILLFGQRLIIGDFQRDMVTGAGAKSPAPG